tara:strand:- start:383 stop:553 length:171 start_codon:yes stop_codon:yes gene_type:complete
VGANSNNDQPFWPLCAFCIKCRVNEVCRVIGFGKRYFFLGSSVNENRSPAPLYSDA